MTESAVTETVATTPVKAPKKKATAPKAKSSAPKKTTATHPPTAQMVNNAIKNLKERGGSSLQAIKKYIAGTYKVDAEKLSPFIKKYLKNAVDTGKLIRTKGQGASGSFKLPPKDTSKAEKKPKKPKVAKKPKAAAKPKAAKAPKAEKSAAGAATPKKPKAKTVKPKVEKPKASPKKKSPSKTKKAPAAKKPKSPKPKKTSPKKAAVKKPAKK